MKRKVILSAIALAFLVGCGSSGGSSDSSSNVTLKGTFIDSPVQGLKYETSSGISGITDENGTFTYKKGDNVTFEVGNVVLGSSLGNSIITPYDLANDTNTAINIAYFLQNLDSDGNVSNGIQLPIDINISNVDFSNEQNITDTLNNIKSKFNKYNFPNITIENAKNNLMSDINDTVFLKVSDIVNKVWYFVKINPLSFVSDIIEMKFDLNSGRLKIKDDNEWENNDYIEKINDYVLKGENVDENNKIYYAKFYKIDNGFVAYKSDEINGIYEKTQYYFFNSYEDAKNFKNQINKNIQKVSNQQ